MKITRDIQSLSDFKQNASRYVKQVQETKEPLVLTVNGRPAVVVQDAADYQRMADVAEYASTVAAIRESLTDVENAKNWPTAHSVFSEIRRRNKPPKRRK